MSTHGAALSGKRFHGFWVPVLSVVIALALVGAAFGIGRRSVTNTAAPVAASTHLDPRVSHILPWMQQHVGDIAWMQRHMGDVMWMRTHGDQWRWMHRNMGAIASMRSHPAQWTWMRGHMGDVAWMRSHPRQWAWMQDHMGDIGYMHDHWDQWSGWRSTSGYAPASGGMQGPQNGYNCGKWC